MQNQHEPYFDYQLIDPKTSEVVATIKALDGVEALMLFRPEYKWAAAKHLKVMINGIWTWEV